MILPWLAVLASCSNVRVAPGDADANDGQAISRECFCDARHEPAFRKLFGTDGMGVGSPRPFAPQQHFPAAFVDGVAPIRAGVDDMAAIREDPCIPFRHAQDVAVGSASLSLMMLSLLLPGLAHSVFQVPIRMVGGSRLSFMRSRLSSLQRIVATYTGGIAVIQQPLADSGVRLAVGQFRFSSAFASAVQIFDERVLGRLLVETGYGII